MSFGCSRVSSRNKRRPNKSWSLQHFLAPKLQPAACRSRYLKTISMQGLAGCTARSYLYLGGGSRSGSRFLSSRSCSLQCLWLVVEEMQHQKKNVFSHFFFRKSDVMHPKGLRFDARPNFQKRHQHMKKWQWVAKDKNKVLDPSSPAKISSLVASNL